MKKLPLTLNAREEKTAKQISTTKEWILASYRGGYIVPAFEVEYNLDDEDLAFKLVSFILDMDDEEKDLADVCALKLADKLADHFGLHPPKENYLSDGVRDDIRQYLKSQVFNLRTIDKIKTPLTISAAKIIHWFNSLPGTDED